MKLEFRMSAVTVHESVIEPSGTMTALATVPDGSLRVLMFSGERVRDRDYVGSLSIPCCPGSDVFAYLADGRVPGPVRYNEDSVIGRLFETGMRMLGTCSECGGPIDAD